MSTLTFINLNILIIAEISLTVCVHKLIVDYVDKLNIFRRLVLKISTKSRYGTRAVLEIALNQNKRNLTRKQISKNQEIPSSYLENILISLKTKGIIRTIRGPKGGYELAKDPKDITIFEIVDILEGNTDLVPCLENSNVCARNSICVTTDVWRRLQKVQEDLLSEITIKDLIEQTKELYSPNFSI